MGFNIQSSAFNNNEMIPAKYTCDAENISPPLSWENAPSHTQSFALIMDDPDAPMGTWDHWLLFNIPANVHEIPENNTVPEAKTGMNSWKHNEYGGACPPNGVHRYFFKLYALDSMLPLNNGATKSEIEEAMKNHIVGSTEMIGKYKRS